MPTQRLKDKGKDSRARTVQNSVSLRPDEWSRLDRIAQLTRWGRSEVVSESLALMSLLPLNLTQRIATLKQTSAAPLLRERLEAAIGAAVAEVDATLSPGDLWEEMFTPDEETAANMRASGVAFVDESDLTAAAVAAQKQVRQEKRARR